MAVKQTNQTGYQFTAWNFTFISLDAGCFFAALAFVDPVAVLPVLVERLGGSEVIIGMVGALQRAGWIVPQIIGTSFVLHRRRKKPYLIVPVILSRIPFFALAVAFSLGRAPSYAHLLLLPLLVVWGSFFFLDGMVIVPWNDIIARTIPPNLRGRFFGAMQLLSAIAAAGAAIIVRQVLADSSLPFPREYGRLLSYLAIGMTCSTIFLLLMKEPEGKAWEERQSILSIIRSIPETLRRYPLLRRAVIAQNLLGFGGLALPFYAVYALTRLNLPKAAGGTFVLAGTIGAICASIIWAYANDRHGPRAVLRGVGLIAIFVPLAALLTPSVARALGLSHAIIYFYGMVFALSAAVSNGLWMGITNYVLEIAPDDIRPLFLGLSQTLAAPTVIMPIIGGVLLGFLSYPTLFLLSIVGLVIAFGYVLRLEQPHQLTAG